MTASADKDGDSLNKANTFESGDRESFDEFSPEELEMVARRKHDPSSRSQKLCFGCFVVGPEERSTMPKIANFVLILAIGMNFYVLFHLWPQWIWLTIANSYLGIITLILMWCV